MDNQSIQHSGTSIRFWKGCSLSTNTYFVSLTNKPNRRKNQLIKFPLILG